jgi:3-oxosteroid 1-dehydrogenase
MPEEVAVKAGTIEELAARTGIDAEQLMATVAKFNSYCETGEDADFGRGSIPWGQYMSGDRYHKPNPNLGPLEKGPFFAVRFERLAGSGIASSGIMADHHCRALGWDNEPIPGLYVAGNSVARLDSGAAMQSGMSNARGMTHGYLAGRHAAGQPSDELEKAVERIGL